MKTIIPILLSLFYVSLSFAQPENSPMPLWKWVNEEQKTVYFLNNPVLKMHWIHLGADNEYWDALNIYFSYAEPSPDFESAYAELQAAYPGYNFTRVLIDGAENVHLSIPALGINEDVKTGISMEGPFFVKTCFVTKEQSYEARAVFSKDNFISFTGNVKFAVPGLPSEVKIPFNFFIIRGSD